mgnify:CR=1 FL=1
MSTATSPLRAGVIGAGVFGGYHAGKYADNPDTTLTAIFDPDRERAQALADKHGVTLPAAALQFPLANDIITSVIPGPREAGELAQILEWFGEAVPVSFWTDLKNAGLIVPEAPVPDGA